MSTSAAGTYVPKAPTQILAEQRAGAKRRPLPILFASVVRLAWRAAPGRLLLSFGLAVLTASGLASMVAAGQSAATDVLAAAGGSAPISGAIWSLVWLVSTSALIQIVSVASQLQSSFLGYRVQLETEMQILDAVTRVPLERFEQPEFHDRVWRAMVNAVNTPVQALVGAMALAGGVLSIVALGTLMASFQWILLPVLLVVGAIEIWFASRSAQASYNAAMSLVDVSRRRDVLRRVLFRREMAAETRAFGLAAPVLKRFRAATEYTNTVQAEVTTKNAKRDLLSKGISGLAASIGWAVLIILYVRHELTLPQTMAAGLAFHQAQSWFSRITGAAISLYGAALYLEGFQDVLDEGAAHNIVYTHTPLSPFQTLALEDVSFTYAGSAAPSLCNVNLDLRRGTVLALVGENGSGKTTLAKILSQLYRPSEGVVRWDGVDTAQLNPEQLRRHIAIIFQDFTRYELSAQENIGFGDVERDEDLGRIGEAARQSGIGPYIESLPQQYQTLLTPQFGGVDLSGGQWQRVALARAFFRDAPLLVLDEPTSALDARAEKELFDHIRTLAAGRTVVLISHRFSTVRSADRIVVLSKGRIVEQGSHQELMAAAGEYAEMYTLQASAFLGDAVAAEGETPVTKNEHQSRPDGA